MNAIRPHTVARWLLMCFLVAHPIAHAQTTPPAASDNTGPAARANAPSSDASHPSSTPPNDDEASENDGVVRILNRSADTIKIGEPLHIRVHVDLPEQAQLVSLRAANNPYVERISDLRRTTALRTGLAVTVFRPGTYHFTVEALWIDAAGQQRSTHSAPLRLRVTETVTDHDHATLAAPGPYLTLRSRNLWLIGGGIAGFLALLSLVLWWFWRRIRPRAAAETPPLPPARPAWEVALEQIECLRADHTLLAEDPVQFHHRISDILRTWLQARFQLRALEMTTEEILDELSPRWLILGEWIDQIHTILADTDLVKFAKFTPSADNSLTLLRQLEDLVREVQTSDSSPPPDIPAPIEGDEPPIRASEHAAPQLHAPGAAAPRYTPEDIRKPTILALDFRGSKATKPQDPASPDDHAPPRPQSAPPSPPDQEEEP